MLSSPRRPSSTMRIFSSAERCRRVALRISRTVFSALSGMRLLACLIVAPQRGYDEPAILSYAISSFCPTGADGLQQQVVISAWQQVGINVTSTMGISGNWVLHFSWGCTGSYSPVNITFNSNGTFTGGANGKWVQQDGTILLAFDTGPAKYAGNVDGNVG